MEPMLVLPIDTGNKITITVDQLRKYIHDAYMAGLADGAERANPSPYYPNPITSPWITWYCDGSKIQQEDAIIYTNGSRYNNVIVNSVSPDLK